MASHICVIGLCLYQNMYMKLAQAQK